MGDQLPPLPRRRTWSGLGWKLFAAFSAVIAVGVVTLWLGVGVTAPALFDRHMETMMSGGMAGTMGSGMSSGAMNDALTAAFRDAMTQALLLATAAALLMAIAASVFVTGRIVGPVRRLAVGSRRLAEGHYTERVPSGPNDELGDLATSFNVMAGALEATERRRRELIGDVSHELRTPIATLEGYLEGLLDGVVKPDQTTWARLHGEAGRLRRLVDDLQELSRAEARQMPLSIRPTDPATIAHVAIERLSDSFAERGLDLETEIPHQLPRVQADTDRAVQVLSNLLTNALRYTPPPGRVLLMLRPVPNGIEFSVRDTGVGIAPEELPRVFERFYRVDKSRNRAKGGSGIGLTIARALVEGMGGQISATSAGPGQGTTVAFTLPAA